MAFLRPHTTSPRVRYEQGTDARFICIALQASRVHLILERKAFASFPTFIFHQILKQHFWRSAVYKSNRVHDNYSSA